MDINNDGFLDIVGGSYTGEMVLYTGSKDGFNAKQFIQEKPYQTSDKDVTYTHYKTGIVRNYSKTSYLRYANPTFGDFNGDGLEDIFMGGEAGPRVMLNEGTKENPKYGERTLLLELDGSPIQVGDKDNAFYKTQDATRKRNAVVVEALDYKANITFYDWDNDGVKDLLIGSSYDKHGMYVISFHKGVQTDNGIRFRRRVPLFEAMDGEKAFPGTNIALTVTDVNGDGKDDLLIGLTMLTFMDNGEHDLERGLVFKNRRKTNNSNRKTKYMGYAVVMYGGKTYK